MGKIREKLTQLRPYSTGIWLLLTYAAVIAALYYGELTVPRITDSQLKNSIIKAIASRRNVPIDDFYVYSPARNGVCGTCIEYKGDGFQRERDHSPAVRRINFAGAGSTNIDRIEKGE